MRPLTYVPLALPLLHPWLLALMELITKSTKKTLVVTLSLSVYELTVDRACRPDQTRPGHTIKPCHPKRMYTSNRII